MIKQNLGVIISSKLSGVIQLNSDDGVSDSNNGKDYIDLSSDDEYTVLQSCYDSIVLPTGIEASVSSFPDSFKMKKMRTTRHLQKGAMKVRSVNKRLKSRHHKVSSSSGHNRHDQLGDLKVPTEDSRMNQKSLNVTGSSSSLGQLGKDVDIMSKCRNFKKFDIIEDHSDHHYSASGSGTMQPPRNWAKKIQEEWRIFKKDLPDMIFVRVYESRMDLLRAVIKGAEGTPYHDGLFFFDVYFPKSYPHDPPKVYYHSGGLRINPNLYDNGYVCLSLLNTWQGMKNEQWTPGVSTMLQVLVSIQGMVLNAKPYFNEPGYASSSGSVGGEKKSLQYNERTLVLSLKTMVYTMKKPPKHFEDLVIEHFRDRAHGILTKCKGYTKGVGVECGVDKGGDSGSGRFKADVEHYIKTLVGAFKEIGAENVEEFMPPAPQNLTQKIRAFLGI